MQQVRWGLGRGYGCWAVPNSLFRCTCVRMFSWPSRCCSRCLRHLCGSGALGWILTQMGRSARGRVRSHCGCKRCSNPSVAARGTYLGCALRHGMQVMVNCTPRGNTIKETHLGKSASVTSRPTQSGGGQRSVASEHEHTPRMLAFPLSSGL